MALARGLLSKIHIARQQLGLQDDVYRQKLQVMFGKGSARDLNLRQAEQLLTEFKRLGWQPQPSRRAAGKPHNFSQLPAEVQVIEAQLAEMRLPWSYADKIAKQMFGVAKVAWLKKPDQLTAILAALHVEQEKRYLLAEVDRLCQGLGIEHPEQAAGLEQLPKGWRRQRQSSRPWWKRSRRPQIASGGNNEGDPFAADPPPEQHAQRVGRIDRRGVRA